MVGQVKKEQQLTTHRYFVHVYLVDCHVILTCTEMTLEEEIVPTAQARERK